MPDAIPKCIQCRWADWPLTQPGHCHHAQVMAAHGSTLAPIHTMLARALNGACGNDGRFFERIEHGVTTKT